MRSIVKLLLFVLVTTQFGCSRENDQRESSVSRAAFGKTPAGEAVDIFTLVNSHGLEAKIISYGGIVTSLRVPDRDGKLDDIALGYDNLDGYLKATPYFGAIIGRYGNRIAKGQFTLDGTLYKLATNDGPN